MENLKGRLMRIEVGKRYVRRDGSVTKPLTGFPCDDDVWACDPDTNYIYGTQGIPSDCLVMPSGQHEADLVREYEIHRSR
jgi:hypothetical protein